MIQIVEILISCVSSVLGIFTDLFKALNMGYVLYGVVALACSYKFLIQPLIDRHRKGGGN